MKAKKSTADLESREMMFNKKEKFNLEATDRLVVQANPKSTISEQFRTIRTNLQFSMVDHQLKTMTVTSAGPASGKSLMSANLAATFAQENQRILLVDSDLRKPTIHKIFNLRNFKGLSTLITEDEMFDQVIQATEVPNLFVMPSGPVPPNPSELLRSAKMDQVIDQLKGHFDMVVFDTPPVLAVTDAQIVATRTDGTLFVVPKGEVKKDQVRKSAELLKNVRANVLGFVMNKVEKNDDSYYYYYAE